MSSRQSERSGNSSGNSAERCGAPSRDEVARFYGDFRTVLLRRCQRVVGDSAASEDALHNAMLKLLQYGENVHSARSILAWLTRVVTRCGYDEARRSYAAPNAVAASTEVDTSEGERLEARSELRSSLSGLEPAEREILIMLHVDELTQAQAAQRLGQSRQTLSKRLRAIRGKLETDAIWPSD